MFRKPRGLSPLASLVQLPSRCLRHTRQIGRHTVADSYGHGCYSTMGATACLPAMAYRFVGALVQQTLARRVPSVRPKLPGTGAGLLSSIVERGPRVTVAESVRQRKLEPLRLSRCEQTLGNQPPPLEATRRTVRPFAAAPATYRQSSLAGSTGLGTHHPSSRCSMSCRICAKTFGTSDARSPSFWYARAASVVMMMEIGLSLSPLYLTSRCRLRIWTSLCSGTRTLKSSICSTSALVRTASCSFACWRLDRMRTLNHSV